MNDRRSPDRLLPAWFESDAPAAAPEALRTDIYRATASIRPRPAWLARLGGNPMDVIAGGAGRRTSRLVPVLLILGVLLLALVIGAIYVGSPRPDDQLTVVPPSVQASGRPAASPGQASPSPQTSPVAGLSGLIAFTRITAGGNNDIAITPPDGSRIDMLITTPGNDDMPAWSPDNTHIAWSGLVGITVATSEGKGVTTITDGGKKDRDPAWSPDGSILVYASSRDGDLDLYAQPRAHPEAIRLTQNDIDDSNPSWSAAANRIAFASKRDASRDIWTMKPDGSDLVRLTGSEGEEDDPAWSPDGSRIAFTSDRDGSSAVYVMNADGTGVERLTGGTTIESDPTWSPDGRFIAFHRSWNASAIVIVEIDTHREVGSITQRNSDFQWPAWRAN